MVGWGLGGEGSWFFYYQCLAVGNFVWCFVPIAGAKLTPSKGRGNSQLRPTRALRKVWPWCTHGSVILPLHFLLPAGSALRERVHTVRASSSSRLGSGRDGERRGGDAPGITVGRTGGGRPHARPRRPVGPRECSVARGDGHAACGHASREHGGPRPEHGARGDAFAAWNRAPTRARRCRRRRRRRHHLRLQRRQGARGSGAVGERGCSCYAPGVSHGGRQPIGRPGAERTPPGSRPGGPRGRAEQRPACGH